MMKTKKFPITKSALRPESPSSLSEAYQLTCEAARLGFDWPDMAGVLEKLNEEMEEFKEALSASDREKMGEELGDLLFVLVNVARFLRIHPEKAFQRTVRKFKSRFGYVEKELRKRGKSLRQSNLAEMDELWEEAKRQKKCFASLCRAK